MIGETLETLGAMVSLMPAATVLKLRLRSLPRTLPLVSSKFAEIKSEKDPELLRATIGVMVKVVVPML